MNIAHDVYTELHCHSAFSLGDGGSTPEALAARAAALGYASLALTDTTTWAARCGSAARARRWGCVRSWARS
jgi:error-prone DNA polymerase